MCSTRHIVAYFCNDDSIKLFTDLSKDWWKDFQIKIELFRRILFLRFYIGKLENHDQKWVNFIEFSSHQTNKFQRFNLYFITIAPENARKPENFWRFQGV